MLQASSYTVQPVRIELSARRLRTTIQVHNLGDEPTTIQAHVVAWTANGAGEAVLDNDEILLNPSIFTIAGGHQQYVRLGLRRPRPDVSESTFRLILEEVPPPPKSGDAGITALLRISVPIFFKPRVPSPQLLWTVTRTSERELRLSAENHGNTHVQIRSLAVTLSNASAPRVLQTTLSYVLQNGRKEWVVPDEAQPAADRLTVQARTDMGDITESLAAGKP